MGEERQRQIDKINRLVESYKIDGDIQSAHQLLHEFELFLKKQSNSWYSYFQGVHEWEHVYQEAMVIFFKLLDEYKIGGDAYFTVYIQKKLPLRLRYFFIKEIRRRKRDLSYSNDQFIKQNLLGTAGDIADDVVRNMTIEDGVSDILDAMKQVLNERQIDMVMRSIVEEESHQSIADSYGISRSRVSKIIQISIERVRKYIEEGDI